MNGVALEFVISLESILYAVATWMLLEVDLSVGFPGGEDLVLCGSMSF